MTSEIEAGEAAVSATSAVDDGLVARAQAGGLKLTGEDGLLQQLTKRVLESALEGEPLIIWGTRAVSGPRAAGRIAATGTDPRG